MTEAVKIIEEQDMSTAEIFTDSNQYFTGLSGVRVLGAGEAKMKITRPPVIDIPGGHVYLFDGDLNGKLLDRKFVPGNENRSYVFRTEEDLSKGNYTLGYGPAWREDVNVLAAKVKLNFGNPVDNESSIFTPISRTIDWVSSYYSIPEGILAYNAGPISVILRKGERIGKGDALAKITLHRNASNEGQVNLEPSSRLQHGETYNVGLYLFSPWRFIAGYQFTMPA